MTGMDLPDHFREKDPAADSAGVSFEGRTPSATPFAGDVGDELPQVSRALADLDAGTDGALEHLVAALAGTRVLVPIIAVADDAAARGEGAAPHNEAALSMVTMTGPGGLRALPVFTSVAACRAWRPDARPVPMEVERAAVSAVAEECDCLVLNVGRAVPVIVPRTATWALAAGEPWTPAWRHPEVRAMLDELVAADPRLVSADVVPGTSQETDLHLELAPGLDPVELRETIERFQHALGHHEASRRISSLHLVITGTQGVS